MNGPWVLELVEDLQRDEGLRLSPYRDTTGHMTIGYGRNLDRAGGGISTEEAGHLLENDVTEVLRQIRSQYPWFDGLPDPAKRAFANMVFQMGLGTIRQFKKMLKALERGDFDAAVADALDSRWARDQTPNRARRVTDLMRSAGGS